MADSRFKVENGLLVRGSNSVFEDRVNVNANLTVTADLLYVGGNLYVTGDQVIAGTTVYDTDILPQSTTGRKIGNTTHKFDGLFRDIEINGNLHPTSNNLLLGNTSKRWDAYTTNVNASGTLTVAGNSIFQANVTVQANIAVNANTTLGNVASGNTSVTGFINVSSSANVAGTLRVAGESTLVGNTTVTANVATKGLLLDHGAVFSNTKSVTTTSSTVIDAFPKAYSNFAKLFISVASATSTYHAIEMIVIHDGTNVLVTRYGEIYNTKLGTFDSNIVGDNVEVSFQASGAGTYTVRTVRYQTLA